MFGKALATAAALCCTLAAVPASAATMMIGPATITNNPGTWWDGDSHESYAANVQAARQDPANAFDSNNLTFYSMGMNGDLEIDVAPNTFGPAATVIEVTNGSPNASFPESAKLYFDGILQGELSNQAGDTTGAGIVAVLGPSGATFTITVDPGVSEILLVDTSFVKYGPAYPSANDGFDISEITYSVIPVPIPPAALLFGSALIGMGLLARRRRRQQTAIAV